MRDPTDEEIAAILSVLEDEDAVEEVLLNEGRNEALRKITLSAMPLSRKIFSIVALTYDMIGLNDALKKNAKDMSFVTALTQQIIKERAGNIKSRLKESIRKRASKIASERAKNRPIRKSQADKKRKKDKHAIIVAMGSNVFGEDQNHARIPLDQMDQDVRESTRDVRGHVEDELHKVSVEAVVLLARQLGIIVQWRTERDARVCEICRPLDGQTFTPENAPTPIDDTHPNCRCAIIPIVPFFR